LIGLKNDSFCHDHFSLCNSVYSIQVSRLAVMSLETHSWCDLGRVGVWGRLAGEKLTVF